MKKGGETVEVTFSLCCFHGSSDNNSSHKSVYLYFWLFLYLNAFVWFEFQKFWSVLLGLCNLRGSGSTTRTWRTKAYKKMNRTTEEFQYMQAHGNAESEEF